MSKHKLLNFFKLRIAGVVSGIFILSQELHDNIEQPALVRAQSGRFSAHA